MQKLNYRLSNSSSAPTSHYLHLYLFINCTQKKKPRPSISKLEILSVIVIFLRFYALCIWQGRKRFFRLALNVHFKFGNNLTAKPVLLFSFYTAFKFQRQMSFFFNLQDLNPAFRKKAVPSIKSWGEEIWFSTSNFTAINILSKIFIYSARNEIRNHHQNLKSILSPSGLHIGWTDWGCSKENAAFVQCSVWYEPEDKKKKKKRYLTHAFNTHL